MIYFDRYLWGLLGLLLLSNVPLFLSMSLTADAVLYDLQARCLLEGGVLYRDLLEPNLPGIVWCHALIRSIAGWSTTALRVVDLTVVTLITIILCYWINRNSITYQQQKIFNAGTCLMVSWFYLGTSEWCHCQRDTWMLLPTLLGLTIYMHTLENLRKENFTNIRRRYLWFLAAGVLFGIAFWLKPFVAIPLMVVLLISKLYINRWVNYLQILLTIISGGLIAGILGVCWMMSAGCWQYFLETLTQWNPDYYQSGRNRWTWERYSSHASRFWPWIMLHLPALFLSLKHLILEIKKSYSHTVLATQQDSSTAILQALYFGWLLQAFAFQQLFDYIHIPGIILGIAVLFKVGADNRIFHNENRASLRPYLIFSGLFVFIVSFNTVTLQPVRLQHWRNCFEQKFDVSSVIKDDLSHWPLPRWQELDQVVTYLKSIKVKDGEVAAYNGSLIQIYPLLNFHAPTRFAYLDVHARCFPRHRLEMSQAMDKANPKYIVCSLEEDGYPNKLINGQQSLPELQSLLSSNANYFPYNQELIFQAKNYLVYRKVRPTGELTSAYGILTGIKRQVQQPNNSERKPD